MRRNSRRRSGGRARAGQTAGLPSGPTTDVSTPVDGNCSQPSPATPRKSPSGLSGSDLRTPPRTPNAERLIRKTSEPGTPSTSSIPNASGAERGDGEAVNGPPALRTPNVSGKRVAAYSGRGLRPSGGKSKSHRKRRKGKIVAMEGVPSVTERLENEEYREQQRVAREEKVKRRAQEIEDDQARKDKASRNPCSSRRRRSGGGAPPSPSTLCVDPRRRQSAPAALGAHQPRSRRKLCGQITCGWAPSAPDVKCVACPGEVVHSTTTPLCVACHRELPDGRATHLRRERQTRARAFVQKCQASGVGMPAVVVQNFEPNDGCLCYREDCFFALFDASGDRHRNTSQRCASCNHQKAGGKWYKVGAEDLDGMTVDDTGGERSGAARRPSLDCHACYCRKKAKIRDREATVKSTSHADVTERPRQPPFERVKERVKGAVARGGIVDWTEASGWLRQAREDDGQKAVTDVYARTLVRNLFDQVAEMPGSDARVVSKRRGLDADGDGRETDLLLFPTQVPDQLVVDLYRRSNREVGRSGGAHLNPAEDKSRSISEVLQEIVQPGRDEVEKMAVVRAAAKVVRRDILNLETLQNVAGGIATEARAEELTRAITPVWDSLKELPPTLVALLQVLTDIRLRRGGAHEQTGGWVWEEGWHERGEEVEIGDGEPGWGLGETATREAEGATGDSYVEGGVSDSQGGAGPACVVDHDRNGHAPLAETHAEGYAATKKKRVARVRRLFMLASNVAKAVLPGQHMASHDLKAAQWAKSKGTTRAVIDFCHVHGLMASSSQLQHREDEFAKVVADEDILPKDAVCAAFALDNCDFEPVMNVTGGQPHLSCIAATAVTTGPGTPPLGRSASLRPVRDLRLEDITEGPSREESGLHFQLFEGRLRAAAIASAHAGMTEGGPATCMEAELRKGLQPEERVEQTMRYAFIQLGSTKRWSDNKATVDRLLGIWRSTPAGKAGAPLIIAGDEETYRFLYHLQTQYPDEYRQIRRYPGDWHMLYHMGKALLRRYWGAGIEFVAKSLGTDDKKSGEGSNYRRAHHHVTVVFEALWAMSQEEYFKQFPATTERPVGHDDHVAESSHGRGCTF